MNNDMKGISLQKNKISLEKKPSNLLGYTSIKYIKFF